MLLWLINAQRNQFPSFPFQWLHDRRVSAFDMYRAEFVSHSRRESLWQLHPLTESDLHHQTRCNPLLFLSGDHLQIACEHLSIQTWRSRELSIHPPISRGNSWSIVWLLHLPNWFSHARVQSIAEVSNSESLSLESRKVWNLIEGSHEHRLHFLNRESSLSLNPNYPAQLSIQREYAPERSLSADRISSGVEWSLPDVQYNNAEPLWDSELADVPWPMQACWLQKFPASVYVYIIDSRQLPHSHRAAFL